MYAVTGATGQLGRLVIRHLLGTVQPREIVAAVRDPAKAEDLAAQGIAVRVADYDRPETLAAAFADVERLLLVSSSEVGRRVAQHRAAIAAARSAGVSLLAYTSLLHADTSPIGLAEEHRQTEAALAGSAPNVAILRNGWYSENNLGAFAAAVKHGVLLGAAGTGRISSAARDDYAAAAAAVLTGKLRGRQVFELAGDGSWSLPEIAEELSRRSGRAVSYRHLSEEDYRQALVESGLPAVVAEIVADADAAAAGGALFDDSRTLSTLIGRPTTPISASLGSIPGY